MSFGILGAGELYYVYFQNYLISCSPTAMVRRNLAYSNLLALPTFLAPILFGAISDRAGLRYSIIVAALLLAAAVVFVPDRAAPASSSRDTGPTPRWSNGRSSSSDCCRYHLLIRTTQNDCPGLLWIDVDPPDLAGWCPGHPK